MKLKNEELTEKLAKTTRTLKGKKTAIESYRDSLRRSQQETAETRQEFEIQGEKLLTAQMNANQYRKWWLNEIQFAKLLLSIADPERDMEVARETQRHYDAHL